MTYKYSVWQVMVELDSGKLLPISGLFTTRELAREELKRIKNNKFLKDAKLPDLFIKEHPVEG